MKNKSKTYTCFVLTSEDEVPIFMQMTGDQIRELVKTKPQYEIAIVDGNLVKDFSHDIDISRL